jgi:hypothetical protein
MVNAFLLDSLSSLPLKRLNYQLQYNQPKEPKKAEQDNSSSLKEIEY